MTAMVLEAQHQLLLERQAPTPRPGAGQVLIRVGACGVCRTDLHILDGELTQPKLPLIMGHEIAGTVVQTGIGVTRFKPGDRVGVPWLGQTCGQCVYCVRGQENLCLNARFTGYTLDGGYAQYTVANQDYCFTLPAGYSDAEAAPLLCAGLIGYRSYRMTGERNERLGLYGFGAAAHIIAQVALQQGKRVFAFTRPGDATTQNFARRLGAEWAGGSDELPPAPLDAAILFAPLGALVPAALRAVDKGGTVVCGGIHMSDIPSFAYALLWEERAIKSVANLTRQDGDEFLVLAGRLKLKTTVTPFPLSQANAALDAVRHGRIDGAAVLIP
ncbi:MAG TPA: zinc-dependent alcohol dehydrogenase family protein [Anaerolineae bacterium]